jgi:hypothetical protein
MAGLPEKMIEYVLETRIDAQTDENSLDTFLEDLILTHIIYMPTNILCNYLKNYYATRGDVVRVYSDFASIHFLFRNSPRLVEWFSSARVTLTSRNG